jgi:hypothetical protein
MDFSKKDWKTPSRKYCNWSCFNAFGNFICSNVSFCQSINLAFFSLTTYDIITKLHTGPVINNMWREHRKNNLNVIKNSEKKYLVGRRWEI